MPSPRKKTTVKEVPFPWRLWKPSKNSNVTCAQSPNCTNHKRIDPTTSSRMPVLVMTRSPGQNGSHPHPNQSAMSPQCYHLCQLEALRVWKELHPISPRNANRPVGNGVFSRISLGLPVRLVPPTSGETGQSSNQDAQLPLGGHANLWLWDNLQERLRVAHQLPVLQYCGSHHLATHPPTASLGARPPDMASQTMYPALRTSSLPPPAKPHLAAWKRYICLKWPGLALDPMPGRTQSGNTFCPKVLGSQSPPGNPWKWTSQAWQIVPSQVAGPAAILLARYGPWYHWPPANLLSLPAQKDPYLCAPQPPLQPAPSDWSKLVTPFKPNWVFLNLQN